MNERRKVYPNELFHIGFKVIGYANMPEKAKKEIVTRVQSGIWPIDDAIWWLNTEYPIDGIQGGGWNRHTLQTFINEWNATHMKTPKSPRINSAADAREFNKQKAAKRINSPSDAAKYKRRYK